jgi:hypothetical protein
VRSQISSRSNSAKAAKIPKASFDRSTLTCEDFQADAANSEVMDRVDQVAQIPAKPVELRNHEHVTVAKRFQALGQARAIIAAPVRPVLAETCVDSTLDERVPLRIGGLAAVCAARPDLDRRATSAPKPRQWPCPFSRTDGSLTKTPRPPSERSTCRSLFVCALSEPRARRSGTCAPRLQALCSRAFRSEERH